MIPSVLVEQAKYRVEGEIEGASRLIVNDPDAGICTPVEVVTLLPPKLMVPALAVSACTVSENMNAGVADTCLVPDVGQVVAPEVKELV